MRKRESIVLLLSKGREEKCTRRNSWNLGWDEKRSGASELDCTGLFDNSIPETEHSDAKKKSLLQKIVFLVYPYHGQAPSPF